MSSSSTINHNKNKIIYYKEWPSNNKNKIIYYKEWPSNNELKLVNRINKNYEINLINNNDSLERQAIKIYRHTDVIIEKALATLTKYGNCPMSKFAMINAVAYISLSKKYIDIIKENFNYKYKLLSDINKQIYDKFRYRLQRLFKNFLLFKHLYFYLKDANIILKNEQNNYNALMLEYNNILRRYIDTSISSINIEIIRITSLKLDNQNYLDLCMAVYQKNLLNAVFEYVFLNNLINFKKIESNLLELVKLDLINSDL